MITATDKLINPQTNRAYAVADALFMYRRKKMGTGFWAVSKQTHEGVMSTLHELVKKHQVTSVEVMYAEELIKSRYTFFNSELDK